MTQPNFLHSCPLPLLKRPLILHPLIKFPNLTTHEPTGLPSISKTSQQILSRECPTSVHFTDCSATLHKRALNFIWRHIRNSVEWEICNVLFWFTNSPSFPTNCYECTLQKSESKTCPEMIHDMTVFFLGFLGNEHRKPLMKECTFWSHTTRSREN